MRRKKLNCCSKGLTKQLFWAMNRLQCTITEGIRYSCPCMCDYSKMRTPLLFRRERGWTQPRPLSNPPTKLAARGNLIEVSLDPRSFPFYGVSFIWHADSDFGGVYAKAIAPPYEKGHPYNTAM